MAMSLCLSVRLFVCLFVCLSPATCTLAARAYSVGQSDRIDLFCKAFHFSVASSLADDL